MNRRTIALLAMLLIALTATPALAEIEDPGTHDEAYLYYPEYEPNMLRFTSGDFSVYLGARIQVHAAAWAGDDSLISNGDLAQNAGFRLRRSRLYLGGQFTKMVSFVLAAELYDQAKSGGPLLDAYIDVTPCPYFGATIGLTTFPFSYGQMVSSGALAHLDRARVSDALAPERQLGLVLHTEPWDDKLTISLGAFNALQRSRETFFGFEGVGSAEQGNLFDGTLSYVARVDVTPFGKLGRDVADLAQSGDPRLGVGGAFFYNPGDTNTLFGWSAYLHAKWMGVHLLAEYIGNQDEPTEDPSTDSPLNATTKRQGVSAEVGYVILRELLGVSVRIEWFDGNQDIDDEQDQLLVTGTVSYYAIRNMLKVQLEYTHREELHGASLENDAVLAGVQLSF